MNTTSPRSEKRRQIAPWVWASGATMLLHGAFLLTLWLWPYSPPKPRETLLEVDLTKVKARTISLEPTAVPPKPIKPLVVPPQRQPRRPIKPKVVRRVRVAKVIVPTPRPVVVPTTPPPTPIPTIPAPTPPPPTPAPTPPPPTPRPTIESKKPTPAPSPIPVATKIPPKTIKPPDPRQTTPRGDAQKNSEAARSSKSSPQGSSSKKPSSRPAGGGNKQKANDQSRGKPPKNSGNNKSANSNLNPNPAAKKSPASSGGALGRQSAPNDDTRDAPDNTMRRTDTVTGANSGSNSRGKHGETASSQAGVVRRRRSARAGSKSSDSPLSSAPTSSKDGTEDRTGPSSPTSPGGGRERLARNFGDGDDQSGPAQRGGLANSSGTGDSGSSRRGRGDDEAAGTGVSGGTRGSGVRGSGGRRRGRTGRDGARIAGDPFGTGGGNGGYGKGDGAGGENGTGTGSGPRGGIRIAKQNIGDDGSGGEGSGGGGRGTGPGQGLGLGDGNGPGSGSGRGEGNSTGTGRGNGRAGDDNADESGSGTGRSRRGGRVARRTGETEDQMGRGIWGGFDIRFFQDKSDHPDMPDATFHPGNPIDWPVFSRQVARKTVPNLNFNWGTEPPAKGMKSTFWSLKASGRIFVPKDDVYEFYFDKLDDAGRLFLDGKKIIDVWVVQESSPSSAKIPLSRGPHDIQIEYVQGPATAASIALSWRSKSFDKEVVGVYKAP